MKITLTPLDATHAIVTLILFGLITMTLMKILQGEWPTREDVGVTAFIMLGAGTLSFLSLLLLDTSDEGSE